MSTSIQKFTVDRIGYAPAPLTIDDAMRLGQLMVMFDTDGKPEHAVAKVLAGQELGIGPMAAIRGFHMIKGKPSISGELVATLIKRSGRYDFRSKVEGDRATVTIYDRGEALDPVTFTIEDAKTAGLTGNENYKKYAADMLFNRAVVRAARRHCPEVIGGAVYLEGDEEIAGVATVTPHDPETGEVIEGTVVEQPIDPETLATDRAADIKALAEQHGVEDMAAVWALAGVERKRDLADDAVFAKAKAAASGEGESGDDAIATALFGETAEHRDPQA